jgi:hypothetical protein
VCPFYHHWQPPACFSWLHVEAFKSLPFFPLTSFRTLNIAKRIQLVSFYMDKAFEGVRRRIILQALRALGVPEIMIMEI